MKIVYDSKLLQSINSESELQEGGLVINKAAFNQSEGYTFSKKEHDRYAKTIMISKKEVIDNPIWRALARDEQGNGLLKEYADATFDILKEHQMMMPLASMNYLVETIDDALPTGKLWYLASLYPKGSGASAICGLDEEGRLVGELKKKSLSREQISSMVSDLIAPVSKPLLEERIRKLYD